MGWLWLLVIALAAFGLLWLGGVSRSLGLLTVATLLVGGAGYALQQNAELKGSPASPDIRRIEIDPGLVAFRSTIMPTDPAATATLAAADDKLRAGDTTGAVELLLDAVHGQPRNAALWTGLGSALTYHDAGQQSPAAQNAFRRGFALAPDQPGPAFFLGLASVQGGDLPAAKRAWLQALELTPRDAPWRVLIAERLVMVDEFIAMSAGAPPPR
ncbi:MAG: cytochrome C biosynthesis protein [Pseudomonadota bacterium]